MEVDISPLGPADSTTDNVFSFNSDTEEDEAGVNAAVMECRRLFKVHVTTCYSLRNMHMLYIEIFKFTKKMDFAQNIDCGYSLEPPW